MFGTKPTQFCDQDYKKLKEECIKSERLFSDSVFPPTDKSLGFSGDTPGGIVWKRPSEIVSDPHLFVDGASSHDFSQGNLGNCWFVAACASIAHDKRLWTKVVPNHAKQEWDEKNEYAGIFHFRFFRMGRWYDVVIDDYLPTRSGRLVYCSSNTENEFWSALLEKAYAKFFGDYESLKAGRAMDALVDMMGGVGENLKVSDYAGDIGSADKLFSLMVEAYSNHSLMSASITGDDYGVEEKMSSGLVATHAYSVTCVKNMKLGTGLAGFFKRDRLRMVRCRNPWGESEWTGAWSDISEEWQKVTKSQKKEIGLVNDDDGEFWMSFEDFCTHFTRVDICHLINTSVFSMKKTWKEGMRISEWVKPHRAGGCFNNPTKLDNPQFVFDMKDEGEVIISLEQEDARIRKEHGAENETIGMTICKADLNRKCRMHDVYEKIESTTFSNTRSVFHRGHLARGRYLLVPSSFDPGHQGHFMIRVYAKKDPSLTELFRDGPKQGGCFAKKFRCAMTVKMIKAVGLAAVEKNEGDDPYCVVKVGGETVKTPHVKNSLDPEWNWRGTFYKKKPESDLVVEVWDHNAVTDKLIGRAQISSQAATYADETVQSVTIYRGKEPDTITAGRVYIQIQHFSDMNAA